MSDFRDIVARSFAVAAGAGRCQPSAVGWPEGRPRRLLALLGLALSCMVLAQAASAIQVTAGWRHSLLVRDDDTLWAWGWNEYGQLGDGSLATRSAPVPVMSNVRKAAGGLYHTVVLKTDGTVWTFGMGVLGQLGVGVVPRKAVPVQALSGVIGIAAGFRHTMALKADGSLWT